MNKTNVICIEGTINTGKSTLIKNTQALYDDLNLLVYPETAREVMRDYPGSENNQDMFQEIIYHRESERLYKLEQDVKSGLYDTILIDRTSLSGWIFGIYNQDTGVAEKLRPSVNKPKLYDNVILFDTPIGQYKGEVDAFVGYNKEELNNLFKKYIPHCYKQCVSYRNYIEDMADVDQYIYQLLKGEGRSQQRGSVTQLQNDDEKDQSQ